ncbi:hypothetical protein [Streptomyces boncukensis]|uniref:Uncharacterized protein n=1 Tax=Streptomyces boncukensis TaxID=2711219 RepID=A0A6G4WVS7_9ACTN|nr:hypothetical protein [Streptomyces boncukensis]NGO69218.1 hypothetical protein [Streptomyces boncukensis]
MLWLRAGLQDTPDAHFRLNKPKSEVQAAAQIIEQILDRVLPGWRTANWPAGKKQPYWRERAAAHRAITQSTSVVVPD